MHRIQLFSTVIIAALVFPLVAKEAGQAGGSCPVSEKVSGLLKEWEKAAAESKSQAPAEREKLQARLAALGKECPVGSRMGPTLLAARDVLAASIACEEANAKSCPLNSASPEELRSGPLAAGHALKTARSGLVRDLHKLVSHATACCSGSACCAAAAKGGEAAPTQAAASASASASKDDACCKELASRVGALKASWSKVGEEISRVPAAKREAAMKECQSLAASFKPAALFPPTVLALAEGFEALETANGKMAEWAQANSTLLASVSDEAKAGFEKNRALIRDTRDLLRLAAEPMKANGACAKEACPAVKGEAPKS